MYNPSSKNKGADQLRSYCEADLRLCFRIGNIPVFSRCGSNMKALGLVVSEKKIFYVFPIVSLRELMTPRGWAIFDPRGMVSRIYKEDHYTLLHTKYESSGPCGFGEEDFFMFFS